MRHTAQQAKEAILHPAVHAHYEKKKKNLKLRSAYAAALTDILRHGHLDDVTKTKPDNTSKKKAPTKKIKNH